MKLYWGLWICIIPNYILNILRPTLAVKIYADLKRKHLWRHWVGYQGNLLFINCKGERNKGAQELCLFISLQQDLPYSITNWRSCRIILFLPYPVMFFSRSVFSKWKIQLSPKLSSNLCSVVLPGNSGYCSLKPVEGF